MKIYAILREGEYIAAFADKQQAHEIAMKYYGGIIDPSKIEIRSFNDKDNI